MQSNLLPYTNPLTSVEWTCSITRQRQRTTNVKQGKRKDNYIHTGPTIFQKSKQIKTVSKFSQNAVNINSMCEDTDLSLPLYFCFTFGFDTIQF